MENENEELFIPKTKHKWLKITLALVLLAGLIAGGYFLYQYKFNNPKTIISNLLDKAKEDVKESFVKEIENKAYKFDGHVKINSNLPTGQDDTIDLLKDIALQLNGEIDLNNSLANVNINTKYKNDKLIDLKVFYENNIIYLLMDGIYDKYLKAQDSQGESEVTTNIPKLDINPKEVQTIINSVIDTFKKEVNNLELKNESTTITVDGKEINVLDNYVSLKNKELNNFAANITKSLLEDQNFVNIIKKYTYQDPKETLNQAIQGITSESFDGSYDIHFYTDKGIFEKKLISVKQVITQNGMSLAFTIDKISDDEMKLSISMMGVEYFAKVKKNSSVINITLGMNALGSYVNVEFSFDYENIKEITKPDVSDSKDINSLTEEENNAIKQKLAENETLKKLIERINGISSNTESAEASI